MPAPNGSRALSVGNGSPSPSAAAPEAGRSGGHAVNGAPAQRSPAGPPTRSKSVEAAPVEVAERYLAPALKAAAAARARTAHIRAAAWAAVAGPVQPYPREWRVEPVAQSPAAPTPGLAPQPAADPQAAPMAAAVTMSAGAGGSPAILPTAGVPASRGLSVAEAERASWILFRPLRRPPALPAAASAASANGPRGPAERPAAAPAPATEKPAAPVRTPVVAAGRQIVPAGTPVGTQVVPARTPVVPARTPAAPARTRRPVAAPAIASAEAVTRPGSARLLPAEVMRPVVPERGQRGQRFTKTIAELQRHQAATSPSEPWGNVVPRPAVPQAAPGGESDSVWSRLWSRR